MREVRKAKSLSQAEFAERCGIGRTGQINFEKNLNQPGAAYLLALEALGIDASYVLTGRPSARNDEESALLHAFRTASPEVKAATLRMLGTVSEAQKAAPPAAKGTKVKQVIRGGNIGANVVGDISMETFAPRVGGKK